jgi:hypothetical protein
LLLRGGTINLTAIGNVSLPTGTGNLPDYHDKTFTRGLRRPGRIPAHPSR